MTVARLGMVGVSACSVVLIASLGSLSTGKQCFTHSTLVCHNSQGGLTLTGHHGGNKGSLPPPVAFMTPFQVGHKFHLPFVALLL